MVDRQLRARGIRNRAVLEAMLRVPRHRFVPPTDRELAYADRALPTADGQTISQPYIVALMTEALGVRGGQRVLEIGAGSGYQGAVLAELGARVVSVETRPALAEAARDLLQDLGYADRIRVVVGDGSLGWPDGAPYERIIVTAAAPHVPAACRRQLADGGRIVIPLGDLQLQKLTTLDMCGGRWTTSTTTACRFVPLVGEDAWKGGSK
jgi:protein-L-isoaspartate(D-aspartate) O-methyltransferase